MKSDVCENGKADKNGEESDSSDKTIPETEDYKKIVESITSKDNTEGIMFYALAYILLLFCI